MKNTEVQQSNIIKFPFKGVRMFRDDLPLIVSAKLIKPIKYFIFSRQVEVEAGTEILVDLDTMIAQIDLDHTYVSMEEIEIVNQN